MQTFWPTWHPPEGFASGINLVPTKARLTDGLPQGILHCLSLFLASDN